MTTSIEADRDTQLQRADACKLLPPIAYDDNTGMWVTSDACIAFGFLSHPIVGAGETTADKVATMFSQSWPEGSIMSISLWACPDIDMYLMSMLRARAATNFGESDVLERLIRDKAAFFSGGTKRLMNSGMYTTLRDFVIFVTVKIPLKGAGLPSDEDWSIATERRNSAQRSLESFGLAPVTLTADHYIHYLSTMLNWSSTASWRMEGAVYDQSRPVNEQVFDLNTDVRVEQGSIRLGSKHIRVLSPKTYPDYVALPSMIRLIGEPVRGKEGIPGNFLVTMNIRFLDATTSRDKLERSKQIVDFQAKGKLGQGIQAIRNRAADFAVFMEGLTNGRRPVQMQHTFVLFGDSEDEVTKACTGMTAFYRDLNLTVQPDEFVTVPLFFGALPFGADCDERHVKFLRRYRTADSGIASETVPIQADWKGSQNPILSYISRHGQPIGVDIFESSGNFNWLCCAASGSGKSFWANDLITSYMSCGTRVFVIDVGRSYEKICSALSGEFLVFSAESKICLNNFQLVKDIDDELDMLVGMIKTMAAPKGGIDEFGTAVIAQTIRRLWDVHHDSMVIDHIADALLAHDREKIRDIGTQLEAFTSKGYHGRWFCGQNNVSFRNQLTVLELEELNDKKGLQTVILLQLLYQITQSLYAAREHGQTGQRTIIIIDEAWALLGEGDVGTFMVTAYRRARKVNGSMGLITQSISDLWARPAVGLPIIENSQWWFLLAQKPESIQRLQDNKLLVLSDGGFKLLSTVHRSGGDYSEIFIYTTTSTGPIAGIGRLVVTRYAQLLYTTDPTEKNMLASLMQQGHTLGQAIEAIIAQEQKA